MNKKAWAVVTVSREIDGPSALLDHVGIRFERVFVDKARAENFVNKLSRDQFEENIITSEGKTIKCVCQVGVHEIDIEG